MKKLLPCASLLFALPLLTGLTALAAPPPDGQESLEARVAKLEEELAASKKREQETRALLEQTLVYLDQRSKGAQALLAVLDESEREGFTAGINFRSREILLAGLRAYWGDTPKGLPKTAPAAAPPGKVRTPAAPVGGTRG
jgi:hypothetical protein